MPAQLISTALGEEAVAAFAGLLDGRAAAGLDDGYFRRDWGPLWGELARDGWTAIADPGDSQFSLLDLTGFGRAWGRFLVPLPFTATLAVRRSAGQPPDPAARLSYLAAEGQAGLIPHGAAADLVLATDGLGPAPELAGSDDWAASAPIALAGAAAPGPAPGPVLADAAVLATAEAVGAASAALHRAVEYAKMREQFGQPIGKFQAVKHRLANMHCSAELAASALAWACSEPGAAGRALRAALSQCLLVAEQSVQVHGGIGFTWEAAPHRYYRHIMSMRRLVLAIVGEE